MEKFIPGDIVWLKTGGPKMTVKEVKHTVDFVCSWFSGEELKKEEFSEDELTMEDPNELGITWGTMG